ncbi:RNA polymerase I specific transcription initiation factor [Colletotrichum scovillei]|uniref:RNA polymerase I specific transcription initiation factor n=1 Tax=Colletotrichum scovillei TaxID=1209932 RepID=UPI0015C3FA6F|nr:RNA polymerase I specific transcription initiation factor [Colletotrichum scovillei]KAF4784419.1 RNA polymerase I specific transcription initiation factor [Colletotrichum scovillei]
MTANEESWDLDTDEIRSVDSEELYETRPNRWKGNKATWNTYTQEERLLHRSMEQVRNRDLSVHLYNAFALRNRAVRPSAAGESEIVDSGEWRPPNLWTAWPMNSRIVPGDDFLKETHDEDDDFTTRSRKEQLPSTALEEELTATIVRQAKERFLRRQRRAREREEAARTRDDSANEKTAASSRSKTYEPVVSANDDLSADLLRPSVRHILSTLDNTLTALHNARLAGLSYMTDSSASATDVEDNNASDAASGRPRSKAPRTPEPEWTRALERRGRPKKVAVPLPGETEKEMKIRIARASKKRIPFSSDEEDAAAAETEGEEDAVVKKDGEGSGAETSRSRSPRKRRDLTAEARAEAKVKARETMLGNWGLRDWSDVIGAASLSGFKPDVVARAAQRTAFRGVFSTE